MENDNLLQEKISELYRTILLREPDRNGLKHWTHQISSGIETLEILKEKLLTSEEAVIVNNFVNGYTITNDDVKLSERINIPSKKLRGFETGRVGPKDGDDFVGGNYAYSLNFSSTVPQIFEESQNVDFLFFADVADIWGVDYDSSLDKSKIRSSLGIGLDWFSPLGPMNFSLAHPITKADGDRTETFRFNLGTTF